MFFAFYKAFAVFAVAVGLTVAAGAPAALAKDPIYTGAFSNQAVAGHDVIAYYEQGQPVEGSSEFETQWQGATWRFSSAENLAKFEADPEAYAPQYGGYCAWAMARGYFAKGDPENWKIVDGRLYLNYNNDVQQKWERDIPGFIEQADAEWSQKTFN